MKKPGKVNAVFHKMKNRNNAEPQSRKGKEILWKLKLLMNISDLLFRVLQKYLSKIIPFIEYKNTSWIARALLTSVLQTP